MLDPYKKPWPYQRLNTAHPLANGLVGCWLMNEGGGNTVFDLSENGNTGSIINAIWKQGPSGSVLYFDGSGDYVQALNVDYSDTKNSSIEFWFKPEITYDSGAGANEGLFTYYRRASDRIVFHLIGGDGRLRCYKKIVNNVIFIYSDATSWTAGQWYHVITTFGSGGMKMYVDGILQADVSAATTGFYEIGYGNNVVDIGDEYYDGTQYTSFYGDMDCVRVYNRGLIASEVQFLHTNPYAMFEPESIWLFGYVAPAAGGNAPTGGLYGSLVGPLGGPINISSEDEGVQDMGDYNTTETVHIPFNTFTSNDPAASCTVTDLVAGDIEIHKDGAVAQRTSDAGVTVSINFDGVTGNHLVHIDLSDNTDVGFYANGSRYSVRLQGITVDAGTLNVWIGSFSIGCVLRPTTDGRTLDIQSTGEVDANITMLGGVVQSGTDLKDFADAGYVPGTHSVALVDTTTANTDMRGTDSAALASVLGALNDAAAAGDPTDADTLVQYIKQLINVLIGTAGIGAFPAEAAPANAVSLAEVIRAIHVDVTGLNGDAMRGTDGANTTVPDAAGVAPTAGEIQTEMEAAGSDLHYLITALVNKMIITELNGNTEQFSDADVSLGSIAAAFSTDGTHTTRKRLVI